MPVRTQQASTQVVRGIFKYATSLGDVRVQQVLGDVDIFTGAGEVQLGAVSGSLKVRSSGGIKRSQAFKRHILTKKTTKVKRHLRGMTEVHAADEKLIRAMLPYA